MKKYKTSQSLWKPSIEAVEVEKETAQSIWIDGRRIAKLSSYDNYFDSFDDAKNFLCELAKQEISKHRKRLESAQQSLETIRNLAEPKEGNHDVR